MKKKSKPYLIILLGLLLLFWFNQVIPAGVFLLLGIVMIIESIWPEKWEADKNIKKEQNGNR